MKNGNHWYSEDGRSCHLTIGKNGQERATTIRDAREKGLFPSVTTVLGILEKPQLNDWKHRQITAAAWNWDGVPPGQLAVEEFHAKIMSIAFQQVEDAADLGTAIHEAIERHFRGLSYDPSLAVYVQAVDEWAKKEGVTFQEHELRLVSKEHGFAGTTDAAITSKHGKGILDFKSRKSKPEYPMTPWDGQPMQVSAYHVAHYRQVPQKGDAVAGCNLFVSTTEPGRVEACWYDAAQIRAEWEAFEHLLAIWRHFRSYDPRRSE